MSWRGTSEKGGEVMEDLVTQEDSGTEVFLNGKI